MAEPRNLLDYQREASRVASIIRPESVPPPEEGEARWGRKASALFEAGWILAVREGVRIWSRSEDWWDMWKSEEVAYAALMRDREV